MSSSGSLELLRQIVDDFEALALNVECAIEALARDDSGTVDLTALHRVRDAARRGAALARDASFEVRRAFD